jgi:ribonuclease Z
LLSAGNTSADIEPPVPVQEVSSEEEIRAALFGGVPGGCWKEGLLFEGIRPSPWMKSASNWFPRTEEVQPNEMRIIFMGSAPFIRPGQMSASIFVQLGNGENLIFDLGEGSPANYIAAGIALNELKDVFITHLHVDHFGGLPYLWMFGTWAGRYCQMLWTREAAPYPQKGHSQRFPWAARAVAKDSQGMPGHFGSDA